MANIEPVAWISDGDSTVDRDIDWYAEDIQYLPVETPLYAIPADHLLISRTLLAALLDGDSNVSLLAAQELRAMLAGDSPA